MPDFLRRFVTDPLTRLLMSVWRPTDTSMRRWALASVIGNAGIVVTGVTVRVTNSGLGCSQWPECNGGSLVPIAHPEHSPLNQGIEFGNRLLTFVVLALGAACFVAALRLVPRRRALLRIAAVQPGWVIVQAVWGGLLVLSDLHPAMNAGHFLLSSGLLAAAVALYMRSMEGDGPPRRIVHRDIRNLAFVLVGAVFVLLAAGTVVTGSGPHGGDDKAPRFAFSIEDVARIHADLAYLVVGLTFALLFALHVTDAPGRARRAALVLLAVELAQGVIGYAQYFLAIPPLLVALHALGSTLVWIAALRVVFLLRRRSPLQPPAPAAELVTGPSGTAPAPEVTVIASATDRAGANGTAEYARGDLPTP
ncbi:COX15/CtaA family protein [Bailinhaonella thermotolerans]|uniref:COX15/CtaA family protein n=1 Tax=Bailinhaonella thermotolerans TaxID=1070861 RepID=UPI003BEF3324